MPTDLTNHVDFGLIILDNSGSVLLWNSWIQKTSGISESNALGEPLSKLLPNLNTTFSNAIESCLSNTLTTPQPFYAQLLPPGSPDKDTKTGAQQSFQHVVIKPLATNDSAEKCLIQIYNSHFDTSNTSLQREKERLEVTLASITDAVIITDKERRIEFLNTSAEQLCGWHSEGAIGRPLDDVLKMMPATDAQEDAELQYLDAGLVLINTNGTKFHIELSVASITNEKGSSSGSVVVFRDISHSRRMEARLFWQSNHDPLTGLENRHRFEHRLQDLLAISKTENEEHALLYLDLDQFKIINDTCGHAAGDELLRQLTSILKYKIRASDYLSRLGGDEFGILLPNCPLDAAIRTANDLRSTIKDFRFTHDGKLFAIGFSMGLVPFNGTTQDSSSIMISADTACITAKDEGRNRVHIFEQGKSEASRRHGEMQWVSRIHSALDDERLTLHSQAIVPLDKQSNLPPHREVLVRLYEEDGTLIPPGAFIPAAERYNLMPAVDRWVVTASCKYMAQLLSKGTSDFFVLNINLSGASFMEEGFCKFTVKQIKHYAIPPEMICFEVTETAAIANLDEALRFINALREIGCKFALDDFGSGLSSFGYLKHLPVDYLKIDGAFIKDILNDPIHSAMVEAINQVGHVMGIKTVAEFVEDEATLLHLQKIGIDYAQGYHIEKPAPLC